MLVVKPANAQASPSSTPFHELPNPSVPEFTLKYVDNSHAVPPSTTTTTDPFTGKQEVITQEDYYIQNSSIQITIKNQNTRSTYLYFDVRMKGHFLGNWTNITHVRATNDFSRTHDSEYTVLTYALEGNNASGNFGGHLPISPSGGIADFQVQAQGWHNVQQDDIFGTWVEVLEIPSEWSKTQTISIPDGKVTISESTNPTITISPSPTVPEFPFVAVLSLLAVIPLITILVKKRISKSL
jgi:hypothetical protein